MKILMVTSDYLPNVGGIASHIYYLSKYLRKLGNDVDVLHINLVSNLEKLSEQEDIVFGSGFIRVNILEKLRYKKILRILNYRNTLKKIWSSILSKKSLQNALNSYDVYHSHSLGYSFEIAKELALRNNAKFVFTNHSSMFLDALRSPLKRFVLKKIHKGCEICIAPSEELAEKSRILKPSVGPIYIPNGVDTDYFKPFESTGSERMKLRKQFGFTENQVVLFAPRRIVYKNGIRFLVEAVSMIPEAEREYIRVILVGATNKKEWLYVKDIIDKLGVADNFVYLGIVKNEEMRALYHLSDFVVIPSLVEAVSIAGLEAAACGKPIVATNVGGLPEIVKDGENGFLVDSGNSEKLSLAIRKMIKIEDKETMMKRSREIAKEFNWTKIAMRTIKAYKSILTS